VLHEERERGRSQRAERHSKEENDENKSKEEEQKKLNNRLFSVSANEYTWDIERGRSLVIDDSLSIDRILIEIIDQFNWIKLKDDDSAFVVAQWIP